MKHTNLRRNLNAAVLIAGTFMASGALAGTQEGGIGGNGTDLMGGYNGLWLPILLIAIVSGLVLWVGTKKEKVNRQLERKTRRKLGSDTSFS